MLTYLVRFRGQIKIRVVSLAGCSRPLWLGLTIPKTLILNPNPPKLDRQNVVLCKISCGNMLTGPSSPPMYTLDISL